MNRIPVIDPATATGRTAELLGAVKTKLGLVPNLVRVFAQSPAVLQGYLGLGGALEQSSLSAAVREQIALAVAELNSCEYCLSAHSAIGRSVGLTPEAIEAARRGQATDPRVAALLRFVRDVVESRGRVSDEALTTVRTAGATDAEIVETIALIVLNIFTNYTNNVARTQIDFPRAKPLAVVAA